MRLRVAALAALLALAPHKSMAARSFAGTGYSLSNASVPSSVWTGTFTVAGFVSGATSPGADSCYAGSMSSGNNGWVFKHEQYNNTTKVGLTLWGVADVTSTLASPTSTSHVAVIFGSTKKFFLNGTGETYTSSSMTAPSGNGFVIGAGHKSGAFAAPFNGSMAEWALWDVALSDAEVASLSDGVPVLSIRPGNIVGYWPIIGRNSPETDRFGGYDMTVASATNAAHVPARYSVVSTAWMSLISAPATGQPTMRRWESVPFMPSGRGRGGVRMLVTETPIEEMPCVGCSPQ